MFKRKGLMDIILRTGLGSAIFTLPLWAAQQSNPVVKVVHTINTTSGKLLSTGISNGGGYIGAGLAMGLSAIGAGVAVGYVGAAVVGSISEKPENMGKMLIFLGLAEGIAIYGLLIAIMILVKTH